MDVVFGIFARLGGAIARTHGRVSDDLRFAVLIREPTYCYPLCVAVLRPAKKWSMPVLNEDA